MSLISGSEFVNGLLQSKIKNYGIRDNVKLIIGNRK
jgi:hypothetical protein